MLKLFLYITTFLLGATVASLIGFAQTGYSEPVAGFPSGGKPPIDESAVEQSKAGALNLRELRLIGGEGGINNPTGICFENDAYCIAFWSELSPFGDEVMSPVLEDVQNYVAVDLRGETFYLPIFREKTPPPPPKSLVAEDKTTSCSSVGGQLVTLRWNQVDWYTGASDEVNKIERSRTSATDGFSEIATVSAETTTYDDQSVACGETWWRVQACNKAGCSSSNTVSLTVGAGVDGSRGGRSRGGRGETSPSPQLF